MSEKHHWGSRFALAMAACVLIQFFLAGTTTGYETDYHTFWAWALQVAQQGPAAFYAPDYFADYPPGGILLLWPIGKLALWLQLNYTGSFARCIIAAPGIAANVGIAFLCYRLAGPRHARGFITGTIVGACPALFYVAGVWKQMDTVYLFFLAACFVFLQKKNIWAAAILWGIALALKPQALILGPVLAICILAQAWYSTRRAAALGHAVCAGVLSLVPALICGIPFFGFSGLGSGLLEKYFSTAQSYPYASLSAANWFTLLGANWAPQQTRMFFLSYSQWGILHIFLITAALAVLAFYSARRGRLCPVLLAAFYAAGIFCFAHRMHERYLLMAVVLTFAASAIRRNRQLLSIGITLGLAAWLNMLLVINASTSQDMFLVEGAPAFALRAISFAVLICVGCLFAVTFRLCVRGAHDAPLQCTAPFGAVPAVSLRIFLARRASRMQAESLPKPPLPFGKREFVLLVAGTLAVGIFSFARLGNLKAPQTFFQTQESVSFEVAIQGEAQSLLIYPGITQGGSLCVHDEQGQEVLNVQLQPGGCFTWTRGSLSGQGLFTVTLQDAQVFELAFVDANGSVLPATCKDAPALFDEQDMVPYRPGYENSMYFDEIYHARSAYETLQGLPIYETTHPPLGKDIMALGIMLFGMTPFGWRCMGTLFGVLLIPEMYLLVRTLCRSRRAGALAAILWSFDFMRFAQSRIGTIDTYAVFFILASALGMIAFCRELTRAGFTRRAVLCLAGSGAAFGCGAAVKWTGLFAGAGLAVLYFWALAKKTQTLQHSTDAPHAIRTLWVRALVSGVVWFVLLPLAIYLASYLPLGFGSSQYGLKEWWAAQQSMYAYHSTLTASHPFESSWFSWPFDARPVWYYMGGELPQGTAASIASFGNPLIFWGGTLALIALFVQQVRGSGTRAARAVLVLWAAQIVPWIPVSRCTFIYHYFAGAAFGVAAMAIVWQQWHIHSPIRAKRVAWGFAICAGVLLLMFYPALSGLPVPTWYAKCLLWFPQWQFYSL